MRSVPRILRHRNRPEDFADSAEALRELAERVARGEILAAAWVVIEQDDGVRSSWSFDRFKARGASSLELQGAMHQAAYELAQENVPE